MGDEGMEALEVEQWLDVAAAGGIAVVDSSEIGAKGPTELGAIGQHLGEGFGDEPGIDVGVIEPLRQPVAHDILEPLLAQDCRVDEAPECGLVAGDVFRFVAQLRPDRIHCGNTGPLGRARLGRHIALLGPPTSVGDLTVLVPKQVIRRRSQVNASLAMGQAPTARRLLVLGMAPSRTGSSLVSLAPLAVAHAGMPRSPQHGIRKE